MAIDFEEGPDVKGGTRYMVTYTIGVLPLREGLTGRAGSRRRRACMPADLAERRVELGFDLPVARKGGEA